MKRHHFLSLILGCFFVTSLQAAPLMIGMLRYNPPFEMQDDHHHFSGFEASIMYEICKRMRRDCIFKPVLFHQIDARLRAGSIDAAVGSIIIMPERKKSFLFSMPYKASYLQFVTLSGNGFKNIQDLTGKTLGAYHNSPAIDFSETLLNHKTTLVKFYNSMKMLSALQEKSIDAAITEEEQAIYWQANFNNIQFLGSKYPIGEGYGIMCNLGREDLITPINQALRSMQKDGTYQKIYQSMPHAL